MFHCLGDPSVCSTSAYIVLLLSRLEHWYCQGKEGGFCSEPIKHRAAEHDKGCPICRKDERYPMAKAEAFFLSLLNPEQQKQYLERGQFDFRVDNQNWTLLLESKDNVVLYGDGRRCITWKNLEGLPSPSVDLMSQCYLLAKKNMSLLLEMIEAGQRQVLEGGNIDSAQIADRAITSALLECDRRAYSTMRIMAREANMAEAAGVEREARDGIRAILMDETGAVQGAVWIPEEWPEIRVPEFVSPDPLGGGLEIVLRMIRVAEGIYRREISSRDYTVYRLAQRR